MKMSTINIIGRQIEVLNANNPSLIGMKGVVVDETKKMIYVKINKKVKMIPKDICYFRIYFENGLKKEIDGRLLIGTIDRRLKK